MKCLCVVQDGRAIIVSSFSVQIVVCASQGCFCSATRGINLLIRCLIVPPLIIQISVYSQVPRNLVNLQVYRASRSSIGYGEGDGILVNCHVNPTPCPVKVFVTSGQLMITLFKVAVVVGWVSL